jgi:hypothetical protein
MLELSKISDSQDFGHLISLIFFTTTVSAKSGGICSSPTFFLKPKFRFDCAECGTLTSLLAEVAETETAKDF